MSLLPAVPAANVVKDVLSASCAVDVVITDRGDGTYSVSYKGSREGDHCLHVSVNGRAIQKSPFAVKVVSNVLLTFGGGPFYDNRGVLYYLATSGGTQPWTNPNKAGVVTVTYNIQSGRVDLFVGNRFRATKLIIHTATHRRGWRWT